METYIRLFLEILTLYIACGFVFSLYFLFFGAKKMDDLIKSSPWSTRILLMPGAMALWIVLLPKMFRK